MVRGFRPALAKLQIACVLALALGPPLPEAAADSGHVPLPPRISKLNGICVDPIDPLEQARARSLFGKLLHRHREAATKRPLSCQVGIGRFAWDRHRGKRVARLFALGYPNIAGRLASETAGDSSAPFQDRLFSLRVLGALAAERHVLAQRALVRLARDQSHPVSSEAIGLIAANDPSGRYQDLYREAALRGNINAVVALCGSPDTHTESTLRAVHDKWIRNPYPEGAAAYAAKRGLQKLALLSPSDRNGEVAYFIAGFNDPMDRWWTRWALRTARFIRLPRYKELLRERLDRIEDDVRRSYGKDALVPPAHGVPRTSSIDSYFDDVLLMYAELGGSLNTSEKRILRHFGYLGSPRERLREILQEER